MKSNWARAMKIELVYEGGKDDDPVDPGGRTNQGIIQREFSAYLIRNSKPVRDVFTMTDAERDDIYNLQYGEKIKFDDLPPGVDIVVVDGAINSGPSQSIKWVQRALGLQADGVLGIVTMQRIIDHPDHDILIRDILDRRRAFLKALKTYWRFGNGWMRRVDSLQRTGQAWASGSVGPEVIYIPDGHKKAKFADGKTAPARAPADATASGGLVTTILSSIQTTLQPLQGNPTIDHVIMGLIVAGSALTAGGILYGVWARRKKAELEDALDTVTAPAPANNDNVPVAVLSLYSEDRPKTDAVVPPIEAATKPPDAVATK